MNGITRSYRDEIEKLVPLLRQYARALVDGHNSETADDLVHQVLAHAMRGEAGGLNENVATRLFSRLIQVHRLRDRGIEHRRSAGDGAQPDEPSTTWRPHRDPGSHATDMGVFPASRRGLETLSGSDREALLLVVLCKFDYPQAAQIVGTSVGTLVGRLLHARAMLGETLQAPPKPVHDADTGPKRPARPCHLRLVKS